MSEPSATISLRDATAADAEGIARVHVASWQRAYRGIFSDELLDGVSWQDRRDRWAKQLAAPEPDQVTVVAVRDGVVLGFATAGLARDDDLTDGRNLELHAIYVHPEHWAAGLGSALQNLVVEEAVARVPQATAVTLWVLRDNQQARAFYERRGFRPDGTAAEHTVGGEAAIKLRYRRPVPAPARRLPGSLPDR